MSRSLPMRIVVSRHPECLHNVDPQGALRRGIKNRLSPLTPVGVIQRDITAQYLLETFGAFDAVLCSEYERTRTIPVAAQLEHCLVTTPLLNERNMGVWHTQMRSAVLAQYPGEEQKLKAAGYYAYQAPEGESCSTVEDRIQELMASDMVRRVEGTLYLSGHGISGLCLRRVLTGASIQDWYSWGRLKNASVSVFERRAESYACVCWDYVPWEGMIDPVLGSASGTEA